MATVTVRLHGRKMHIVSRLSECDWCPDFGRHTAVASPRLLENELRRALDGDTQALTAVRSAVGADALSGRMTRTRNADLIRSLMQSLSAGSLIAVECRPRNTFKAAVGVAEEPVPLPPAPPPGPPEKVKTWIEIELVDERGEPVPNERYRIELPDGTITTGTLDAKGRARVAEIDPAGQCKVSFPGIDGREWRSA